MLHQHLAGGRPAQLQPAVLTMADWASCLVIKKALGSAENFDAAVLPGPEAGLERVETQMLERGHSAWEVRRDRRMANHLASQPQILRRVETRVAPHSRQPLEKNSPQKEHFGREKKAPRGIGEDLKWLKAMQIVEVHEAMAFGKGVVWIGKLLQSVS